MRLVCPSKKNIVQPNMMIGSPIQNRQSCLVSYLENIRNLNYPKEKIHLAFLLNNSHDDSYEILKTFRNEYLKDYRKISIWDVCGLNDDYQDFRAPGRNYKHIADARNLWLTMFDSESEYLFSIDSDILVEPETLNKLLSRKKDICSALIWNNHAGPTNLYNILRKNRSGYYKVIEREFEDDVIEVDVTGACYLINRNVIDSGVRYSHHTWGEDFGFCIAAQKKGFEIFCDTTQRPYHIKA